MTSQKSPTVTDPRVTVIAALAKGGLTLTNLQREDVLLAMLEEALQPGQRANRVQQANILWAAFSQASAASRLAALAMRDSVDDLTPSELEQLHVVAASELLGLTDDKVLIEKLGKRQDAYRQVERRYVRSWTKRKLRASIWFGGAFYPELAERNAKELWWPAFLAAVQRQLASQPIESAPHGLADSELETPTTAKAPTSPYSPAHRRLVTAVRLQVTEPTVMLFLLMLGPVLVVPFLPATTWHLLNLTDTILLYSMPVLGGIWFLATGIPRWRLVGASVPGVILAALLVLVTAHVVRYVTDTDYAEILVRAAHSGDAIYVDEFNRDGSCPAEQQSGGVAFLHLTDCVLARGAVRAQLTSPYATRLGVYPTGDTAFSTVSTAPTDMSPSYYLETRLRPASGTPVSACGISLEAYALVPGAGYRDRSILFHLRPAPRHGFDSYASEIIATNLLLTNIVHPTVLVSDNVVLPFVERASILGLTYNTWTKMAVVVKGDHLTFLVDNRTVASVNYPNLDLVKRASVAVVAGGSDSGGTATCVFDYLRIRRLPG